MFYHSKVQYGVPQDSVDLCCSLYITQIGLPHYRFI